MASGMYLLRSKCVGDSTVRRNVLITSDSIVNNDSLINITSTGLNSLNDAINYVNTNIITLDSILSDWYVIPAYVSSDLISIDKDFVRTILPNIVEMPSLNRSITTSESGEQLNSILYSGYTYKGISELSYTYDTQSGLSSSSIGIGYDSSRNVLLYSSVLSPYYYRFDAGHYILNGTTYPYIYIAIPIFSENIISGNSYSFLNKTIKSRVLGISFEFSRYTDKYYTYIRSQRSDIITLNTSTSTSIPIGAANIEGNSPLPYTPGPDYIDIADCTVVLDGAQFFTGNVITPTVQVYYEQTQLTQDVDFTVGYTNNVYVGQANVNIAGIVDYTGTRQEHFNIVRANISQATVTVPGSPFTYTGNPIEPDVQVTLGGYTAHRTVDYVLRYTDNVNIGTGSIQIDCAPAVELGTGNFTGSRTVTFQIVGNDTPYNPGGTTTPEIGPTDGTWTLENDILSDAPSVHNDLSLGLFRTYAMTKAQLMNFSKTLWRPTVLQALKLILSNPLDTIISLGSYPFIVNSSSTAEQIDFNWIDEWIPDGWQYAPTGYPLTTEYQTFTFGQIKLDRYSGTFYDYQPFSEAQIYIPYIGFINVKVNEILNKTIELKYNVNLVTGDFTAILELANHVAPQIIGEYQGNMLRELPLAMSTFVDFVGTSIKTAAIVGAAMVAAHSTAQIATSAAATSRNLFDESLVQADMGNYDYATKLRNQSMQIDSANKKLVQRDAKRAGMAIGASAIGLVTSANQPIPRNGSIGAVSGRTSTQEAFLAVALPHQNIPSNQGMLGYPTNLPGPLENYKGYTEVRDIHIKSATATYSELIEIEKIVRGGIVI